MPSMVALPTWQVIFLAGVPPLAVLVSIILDRLAFRSLRRALHTTTKELGRDMDAVLERMDRDSAEFRLRFKRENW